MAPATHSQGGNGVAARGERYWIHSDPDERGEQRRCARGEWCASGARARQDDGTTRREAAETYRSFCDKDWELIRGCLKEMPGLHTRLHAAIGDHITREVVIRVPFGPSVPLRLDVDEVMRLLVDCALSWHERVAHIASLSAALTAEWRERSLGMRSGELLSGTPGKPGSPRILAEHLPTLLGLQHEEMRRPSASPVAKAIYGGEARAWSENDVWVFAGGEEAGNEILRLDWLGRAALLETEPAPERLIGVHCRGEYDGKACGRLALRRAAPPQHDGDPEYYSVCAWCGDLMTPAEYAEWTTRNAAFYRNRPVATLGDTPAG